MKAIKLEAKTKYVIKKYNKEHNFSEPEMIVQKCSIAIQWCAELNKLQKTLGLDKLYEYEWIPIKEYNEVEVEIEEGEE